MKQMEEFISTWRKAMEVKNCIWAQTLPDLLRIVAAKLSDVAPSPISPELLRARSYLKQMQIILEGGTPIEVACQYCKVLFDAKPGGEPYPPGKRTSHGICDWCKFQRSSSKEA